MKHLSEIVAMAKIKGIRRLIVAAADDDTVLKAIKEVVHEGYIVPILVGNKANILKIASEIKFNLSHIEIIDESDPTVIAYKSVSLITDGKGDILMKGFIATGTLLKAAVDKEKGLRKNNIISHFTLFESKHYHKLLGVTDVAMNIAPNLDEKIHILNNAVEVMHKLGINNPKVAIVTPVETVNEKIESTVHAAILTVMNKREQISGCIVDGPLAFDNAISFEATKHKKIISEVAGDADIILVPNLDSGNILYKSLLFMGEALSAAIITGAKVPIVLTSRAASEHSKIVSIALAASLV
jgi:phosphate butyryltransferase